MLKLSDFDFELPKELIAQYPLKKRDQSKLLVVNRQRKEFLHKQFRNLVDYVNPGDLLVLNNTKVICTRLFGRRKETGGKVEALLLEKLTPNRFRALIKPLGRLRLGEEIPVGDNGLTFKLIDAQQKIIEFNEKDVLKKLSRIGYIPLPPYIKRDDGALDRERYQTVYASKEGAIAAPTAGLHFTQHLLDAIRKKGVRIAFVTLHVGHGTFSPVKAEDITQHHMEKEYFHIPAHTARLIRETKRSGGRVIAVGTTVCRTLEANSEMLLGKKAHSGTIAGTTDLFIYPSFQFRCVDALLTNFHLPKSTLFMLVCAFAGKTLTQAAYEQARHEQYRFFSYGDAMLIQ